MGTRSQTKGGQNERPGERGICSHCGLEYVPYLVFITDDFVTVIDYVRLEDEGYLCGQCLFEFFSSHKYAITEDPDVEMEGEPGARVPYDW